MKPYLALDIETTGINLEKSQVIQLAAVFVNPGQPDIIYNKIIRRDVLEYGESYALGMNGWIFEQMNNPKDILVESILDARLSWDRFIYECSRLSVGKITVAGKNVAGFDLPILKNNGFSVNSFKHRVIDVGTLYLPDFGYVPTLNEINKLNGREVVSHNALDDCYDVIAAINKKVL